MKQSTKLKLGLEDSNKATIYLDFVIQLKEGWWYPNNCQKFLYLKGLQSCSTSNVLLYIFIKENATKNFEVLQS